MSILAATLTHLANNEAYHDLPYPPEMHDIANLDKSREAYDEISCWPGYAPTPLYQLDAIASEIGVAGIVYKDESQRFHLKSFKALGGAFAVARQLQQRILAETGETASIEDLLGKKHDAVVKNIVISCGTDGNHGRSVAWGCQMFGCDCVIYIHRDVSAGRKQAMEEFGANVIRVDGNYDDSVKQADMDASSHGRIIVSDTSYPGYMDIPRDVAIGYTVMLLEAVEQMQGAVPSHVFIQAGVGGLAASVCAYFWELWGDRRPRFIVVEPEQANCLQQSAASGKPVAVEGELETLMAGLSCGEVSLLAWEILEHGADDFVTLSEDAVAPCMRLLANNDPVIEAGESAVAGLAAAIVARENPDMALQLGLDESSLVFVIGTEGATDPELYRQLAKNQ
ncbi:MAG: diaminopropionate ammonia-lyase [Gammaproteobacteria bacterium]|nr:MAG: diaminopropionate ammonia-lyase [Gammaproteobacteria bacterium]UCH41088.1 MAG: diaminopropionate ammonia-lyase [Gammaproteobacteria bacterium]